MQTMELVNIEDVYPYEENDVRMNPRDVSSRECREYIEQLAEQFKRNRLNPGQPRVRPILYRDGGIYQIIDGECRYEAMRLIGTKRFYADVFDDLADAELARQEAAKAMVETDSKRRLTGEEMSRGVQTMFELGVPAEEVAASARMDVGRVRRARRGARAVDDAAYDMTLDRLCAIAEFEGDADAVAALRDCRQSDWRLVYDGLVARRRGEENAADAREALSQMGVEEVGAPPEGMECVAVAYIGPDVEDAGAAVRRALAGAGAEAARVDGYRVYAYAAPVETAGGSEPEPEETSRLHEGWEASLGDRARWVAGRLGDPGSMPQTASLLTDYALDLCEDLLDEEGAEIDAEPCAIGVAVGWSQVKWPGWLTIRFAKDGIKAWIDADAAARAIDVFKAMEADGYEPSDAEAECIGILAEKIAGNGGKGVR